MTWNGLQIQYLWFWKTFFAPSFFFTRPPIFLPLHIRFYPSISLATSTLLTESTLFLPVSLASTHSLLHLHFHFSSTTDPRYLIYKVPVTSFCVSPASSMSSCCQTTWCTQTMRMVSLLPRPDAANTRRHRSGSQRRLPWTTTCPSRTKDTQATTLERYDQGQFHCGV